MILNRKAFLDALRIVAPATKKGHLPILHCVRIADSDGAIQVVATDLETSIKAEAGGNGIWQPIVVPHAPLLAFVGSASDDIGLDVEDNDLLVTAGGSKLRLHMAFADDFPAVRDAEGATVHIDAALAGQLGSCIYAASRDQARPILTGLGIVDGWAVCTDSYRLSAVKISAALPNCIIPAHVVEQVLKHTKDGFDLTIDNIRATFTVPEIGSWTTRLIEGQYPSWQRLVGTTTGTLSCDRHDILAALDQVDVFDGNNTPVVKATPTDAGIRFSMRSDDGDEVSATIAGKLSGDAAMAFTPKYLLDLVKSTDADTFEAGVDGTSKPVTIGSLDDGRVQLLMPVRAS